MVRQSWWSFLPAAVLALLIAAAGQAKLTPALTPELHAELSSAALRWSSVLPTQPEPALLLLGIGGTEVVSGLLLLLSFTRRWGALLVLVLMLGAVGTHVLLHERFAVPAGLAAVSAVVWLLSAGARPRSAKGKKH